MSPTFCRHNRFIERCPICRETVPGLAPAPRRSSSEKAARSQHAKKPAKPGASHVRRGANLRVRREVRSEDDGYRCQLVPGLRSSHDAERLAQEIAFASGRLLWLGASPGGVYAQARECADAEQATWMCFLAAYLCPLEGEDPFAGIEQALGAGEWGSGALPDLAGVPLGPRACHEPQRGAETLGAYRRFAEHAGSQQQAFTGQAEWNAQRRFSRVFERLALPGFVRVCRYDLLVTLGRLGLYELRAESLHLGASQPRSGADGADHALSAAKRVFGIGDPLHLERRADALAQAGAVPIEAFDLALWNWGASERATLGAPPETLDEDALRRMREALEL